MHSTDLHFNQRHFEWLWQQRTYVDAICLTGDFLDTSYNAALPIPEQIDWIVDWLNQFDSPIFICSGNHDDIGNDEASKLTEIDISTYNEDTEFFEYDDLVNVSWINSVINPHVTTDGDYRELNGYTFGCIGYRNFNFSKFKHCEITLTHIPPENTAVSKLKNGDDYGCDKLLAALELGKISPQYLLSGHIHEPIKTFVKFNDTWLSNPGSSSHGDSPLHRIIELK